MNSPFRLSCFLAYWILILLGEVNTVGLHKAQVLYSGKVSEFFMTLEMKLKQTRHTEKTLLRENAEKNFYVNSKV